MSLLKMSNPAPITIDDRVAYAQPGAALHGIFQDIANDLRDNGLTSTGARTVSIQGSLKDIAKKITVSDMPKAK